MISITIITQVLHDLILQTLGGHRAAQSTKKTRDQPLPQLIPSRFPITWTNERSEAIWRQSPDASRGFAGPLVSLLLIRRSEHLALRLFAVLESSQFW